jgi:hypothetical protein
MVVAIAEDPGFADRAIREWSAEQAAQAAAAPRPILVDRLEPERIQGDPTSTGGAG